MLFRSSVGAVLLTIAAAAFIFPGALPHPEFGDVAAVVGFSGGLGLVILWFVVIAVVHSTTIRPRVITRTEIVLKGVAEAFVEAVQQNDRERLQEDDETRREKGTHAKKSDSDAFREERRGQRGDDAGEPQPRNPPSSDAIEE